MKPRLLAAFTITSTSASRRLPWMAVIRSVAAMQDSENVNDRCGSNGDDET
jgi:hypothetical protein